MAQEKPKNVLFWIVVILFALITLLTIWGVFIGFENLDKSHKDTLFYTFLVEIGVVALAIIRSDFLKGKGKQPDRLWLSFDQPADIKSLPKNRANCSPRSDDGKRRFDPILCPITLDQAVDGYYIAPDLPSGTDTVFVSVKIGDDYYEGTYSFKSHKIVLSTEN